MSGDRPKLELSLPQIAGAALAAVTAAVAASFMGVAGTFIGAAVVSVASTVGSAVYTHYLRRSAEKVKERTVDAWRRPDEDEGELATAVHSTRGATRDAQTGALGFVDPVADTVIFSQPAGDSRTSSAAGARRPLPWLKLALTASLIFAISVTTLLVIEIATNQKLGVFNSHTTQQEPVNRQPVPTGRPTDAPVPPTPTPTHDPTDTPTTPPTTPTHDPTTPPTTPTAPPPDGSGGSGVEQDATTPGRGSGGHGAVKGRPEGDTSGGVPDQSVRDQAEG